MEELVNAVSSGKTELKEVSKQVSKTSALLTKYRFKRDAVGYKKGEFAVLSKVQRAEEIGSKEGAKRKMISIVRKDNGKDILVQIGSDVEVVNVVKKELPKTASAKAQIVTKEILKKKKSFFSAEGDTAPRTQKIMKIVIPTVIAGAIIGTAIAYFGKKKPMGYLTNIVGFGIVALIGGVVVSNVVIEKQGI